MGEPRGAENLGHTGIRYPDRSARSEWIHWLCYRDPQNHIDTYVYKPLCSIFTVGSGAISDVRKCVESRRSLGKELYCNLGSVCSCEAAEVILICT